MSKKTIVILYLIGLVLLIVGSVLSVAGAASAVTVVNGVAQATGTANTGLVLTGSALSIIGGIMAFIAWIGALINAAKASRWGWFVCLIIFSGIAMLVYLFVGPVPARKLQVNVA